MFRVMESGFMTAFLGLANQFGDRVPRYALIVSHLTSLTRSKTNKISPTPEAIIEFENVKSAFISPMVLQQLNYNRKTIVYTDASVSTQDASVSGVVTIQEDIDGKEYFCCFASSRLAVSQRNYHAGTASFHLCMWEVL